MPAAPRPKGKAKKIYEAVFHTSDSVMDKKTKKQKEIDEKLLYQNTQRVR